MNAPSLTSADRDGRMGDYHRPLASHVADLARRGQRVTSIGGDCCAPIAVLAGLQRAGVRPVLLWLDAHGDFNTEETTVSGFVGGMPLAKITGRGDQALVRGTGLEPLSDTEVVLFDARDLDPAERELLVASGVSHVTRLDDLLKAVPDAPLYVHFDADVISPADAPAMLFPAPGGPSADALGAFARTLHDSREVVAVSMTPWATERDTDGRTADVCWRVFDALAG